MVPDCTGEDVEPFWQLSVPIYAMSYLFPVHQIFAMEDRYTGKIFESTCNKVVVITHPAYAGIGIKPWNNGIPVSCSGCLGGRC